MDNAILIIHKAYKSAMTADLVVDFPDARAAQQFRQTAYNAIRPVKTGKLVHDVALVEAVRDIELVKGDTDKQLIFRKRTNAVGMIALANALGLSREDVETLDLPDDFAEVEALLAQKTK